MNYFIQQRDISGIIDDPATLPLVPTE